MVLLSRLPLAFFFGCGAEFFPPPLEWCCFLSLGGGAFLFILGGGTLPLSLRRSSAGGGGRSLHIVIVDSGILIGGCGGDCVSIRQLLVDTRTSLRLSQLKRASLRQKRKALGHNKAEDRRRLNTTIRRHLLTPHETSTIETPITSQPFGNEHRMCQENNNARTPR